MADEAALLPGTLDVLILKSVSLAPEHGYGVLLRIQQITGGALLEEDREVGTDLLGLEAERLAPRLGEERHARLVAGAGVEAELELAERRGIRQQRVHQEVPLVLLRHEASGDPLHQRDRRVDEHGDGDLSDEFLFRAKAG